MNLIDQVFAQQSSGSAEGQGFGQFFAEGVNQGQRQQQIDIAKQQLAMELAQMPLKQTLLMQDAAYKAAQTEELLHANQIRVQSQEALAGLAGIVSKAWTEATPQDAIPFFFDAVQRNPVLAEDQRYKMLWNQNQTAIQANEMAQYHRDLTESRNIEKDRAIREASRVGELTKQLRESQAKTLEPDEGNPEYRAELTKQEAIRAELSALQKNTANVTPELKIIEGKKFLVNPKTGAVHEISKTVGKREFIAEHVASWIRDNPGMSQDEAGAAMGEFYDKYIGEATGAPPSPSVAAPATVPSYRYNPSSGRIEPIK